MVPIQQESTTLPSQVDTENNQIDSHVKEESIFVSDECYTEEVVLQTEDTEHLDENDDNDSKVIIEKVNDSSNSIDLSNINDDNETVTESESKVNATDDDSNEAGGAITMYEDIGAEATVELGEVSDDTSEVTDFYYINEAKDEDVGDAAKDGEVQYEGEQVRVGTD